MNTVVVTINGILLTDQEVEMLRESNRRRLASALWCLSRLPRLSRFLLEQEAKEYLLAVDVAVMLGARTKFPGVQIVNGKAQWEVSPAHNFGPWTEEEIDCMSI